MKKSNVVIARTTGILSLEEMCFPVWKETNPDLCTSGNEFRIYVRPTEGGERINVNTCSKTYKLVANKQIFPAIEQIFEANKIQFRAKYSHINFCVFNAKYIITDKKFSHNLFGNDEIIPMLTVRHSYNGQVKYTIKFGLYRLVCSNGLTVPADIGDEYKLDITGKHTQKLSKSLEALNSLLVRLTNDGSEIINKVGNTFEQLAKNEVDNVEERLEEVMKVAGISLKNRQKQSNVEDIISRIEAEMKDSSLSYTKVNDWLIYNGINQHINDDNENIKLPEIREKIDQRALEFLLKN